MTFNHHDGIDGLRRRAARLRAEGLRCPGRWAASDVRVAAGAAVPRRGGRARTRRPGVALGLAVTVEGGDVLLVEAACLPGRGTLHVTGRPGR